MAGGIVKCEEMQSKYMTNLKRLFCSSVIFLPVCTVSVHIFLCWLLFVGQLASLIVHLWQAYRHAACTTGPCCWIYMPSTLP